MKKLYIPPIVGVSHIDICLELLTASLNGRVIINNGGDVSDEEEPIIEADIKEIERNPWEENGIW